MTVIYPAIFTQTGDKENTVLVDIPDLNGATEGYGIEDAIVMAKDYIGNALFNKKDSDIPVMTAIKDIDVSKSDFFEDEKTFVSLVDVNLDSFRRVQKSKTVRRNITLPEWLDDMATAEKINVSAVAQEALCEKLAVAM